MGGFFGAVSNTDCVCDLYYGTDYHSHLGTKRGGLALQSADGNFTRKIHDISNAQFRSKFDNDIPLFTGVAGIGCGCICLGLAIFLFYGNVWIGKIAGSALRSRKRRKEAVV